MKHLLIVGARGWGREVFGHAIQTEAFHRGEFDIKGFLDSMSDAFDGLNGQYPPILCSPEEYSVQPDDLFFVAMGDPKWRKYYADIIEKKGGHFTTIIGKDARVFPTATIGEGSFISPWSIISDNVIIGKHAIIHGFSTLGHDAKVGDFSTLEACCFLGGYSEVGSGSTMHVRSTLIRHKKIGNNVVVGACSLVIRNVKDETHVFGVPAKKQSF